MQAAAPGGVVASPEFDQVGALLSAANQALTRAMNANPAVTKPGDVKALVDAAANALKLIARARLQTYPSPQTRAIVARTAS